MGMFIHFAPNTWQNSEYDTLSTPPSAINPNINTDQWAEESAGEPIIRRFALFDTGTKPPLDWTAPVQVWADDKVGSWSNYRFRVHLSKKIFAAAQYRLRFVAQGSSGITIEKPELRVGAVPEPDLVRPSSSEHDTLILTVTAVGQEVVIEGRIRGTEQGVMLLRRL
jgi:alpha-L-fucosidase